MNEEKLTQLERLAKLRDQGALSEIEFEEQKRALLFNIDTKLPDILPSNDRQAIIAKNEQTDKQESKSGWGKWVIVGFVALLAIALIDTCSEKQKDSDTTSLTDTSSIATATLSDNATALTGAPPIELTNWTYYNDTDKMGATIFTASTDAKDLLIFDFPYNGGSVATFTIRKKAGSTDAYLRVSKGQFIVNSYDGGQARIRLDDGKPVTYSLSGAADGSSDIVFFDGANRLINKLKRSKKMVIEAQFYSEGNQQIEFNVADLKWKH